jgi:hypothetical protein
MISLKSSAVLAASSKSRQVKLSYVVTRFCSDLCNFSTQCQLGLEKVLLQILEPQIGNTLPLLSS